MMCYNEPVFVDKPIASNDYSLVSHFFFSTLQFGLFSIEFNYYELKDFDVDDGHTRHRLSFFKTHHFLPLSGDRIGFLVPTS